MKLVNQEMQYHDNEWKYFRFTKQDMYLNGYIYAYTTVRALTVVKMSMAST